MHSSRPTGTRTVWYQPRLFLLKTDCQTNHAEVVPLKNSLPNQPCRAHHANKPNITPTNTSQPVRARTRTAQHEKPALRHVCTPPPLLHCACTPQTYLADRTPRNGSPPLFWIPYDKFVDPPQKKLSPTNLFWSPRIFFKFFWIPPKNAQCAYGGGTTQ